VTASVRVRFGDGTIEDRPARSPYFMLDPSRYPCTPNDATWSLGDGHNPRPGWRMNAGWGGGLVGGPLRDAAAADPAEVFRCAAFVWRITEDGGRWERAQVETFEEQIERSAQEQIDVKAVRVAVLAEREACAALADEGIGWPGEAPASARCIAAKIRARGSK